MKSFIDSPLKRLYLGVVAVIFLILINSSPQSYSTILEIKFSHYTLCLVVGFVMALWGFEKFCLPSLEKFNFNLILLGATIVGLAGARLWYVLTHWGFYSSQPGTIFVLNDGGLVIWGTLVFDLIFFIVVFRQRLKLLMEILTGVIVFLPLAQAIGRWGNFFNGELFGVNGEPLFLYESLANLVLFLILWGIYFSSKDKYVKFNLIAGGYLLSYGLIRLILQPWRPDNLVFSISSYVTSVVLIVLSVLFLIKYKGYSK